jgi:hypothetical protein
MTIPVPFLESSAEDFASCHLQEMTTRGFLVGDEWVEYYGNVFNVRPYIGMSTPMGGIIFESYTESDTTPGVIQIMAKGETFSVETFTLVGEINRINGGLRFCKQCTSEECTPHQYSGVMTPFGMVGT